MSNYSEITYWLTLINESGLKLNIIKPIIQQWCITGQRPLAETFDLSPLEWATTFGLADAEVERIIAVPEKLPQQATKLAQWQADGLTPLIYTDRHYPHQLLNTMPSPKQPLILWTRGAPTLLNMSGVAMLGNGTVDEETDLFLDELLPMLTTKGIGLISGYGRGLDRLSLEKLLKTPTGQAIVVLPMGLNAFAKTTTKLNSAVKAERVVLVSPFSPDTPFQENLATARNLLIDHLAVALLTLQIDEATQNRSLAAIERGLSVFVPPAETPANQALLDQGALPLTDLDEVVDTVQQTVIDEVIAEADTPPEAQLDDYTLHTEQLEPLDSADALKILSTGGKVPPALLKRLGGRG